MLSWLCDHDHDSTNRDSETGREETDMVDENRRDDLMVVSLDDIPDFATEAEERAFWATHHVSPNVYEQMPGAVDDDASDLPLSESPPHYAAHGRIRLDLE